MNLSANMGSLALSLTWILPLLTALALAAFPSDRRDAIRRFSLVSSGLVLALVACLSLVFALHPPIAEAGATRSALAFAAKLPWLPALDIHYQVGVDAISMSMMFLAAVIVFCGTLASWEIGEKAKEFFILLQVLAAGVFGCFISFDLFTFFVFNELTLIPTYLLIGLFGSQNFDRYTWCMHGTCGTDKAGEPTGHVLLYGTVLTALVAFLLTAAAIYFFVVVPVGHMVDRAKKGEDPTEKECPECLSTIPVGARRCMFCTAELATP